MALDTYADELRLLRQVDDQLAALDRLRTALRHKIKRVLGDTEIGTVAGQPVVTWKRTLRVGVSQKLLKQRFPELVPEILDITEVRTFVLVNQ